MTSQFGSAVYCLSIEVLEQTVIGPDDVRNVEKPAVTPIRLVYDRIISHRHVYINMFVSYCRCGSNVCAYLQHDDVQLVETR